MTIELQTQLEYWKGRVSNELDKDIVKDILKHDEELKSTDHSPFTRREYLKTLLDFFSVITMPPHLITTEELYKYLVVKERTGSKASSRETFYRRIAKFLRWHAKRTDREIDLEIEFPNNTKGGVDKQDWIDQLPTEEEVNKMIALCNNTRDRALLSVLAESGARIGEILRMNFGNVQANKKYIKITLRGRKTSRDIPIVWGAKNLMKWIDEHPTKNNDDPLWMTVKGKLQHISYMRAYSMLKKVAAKAGIEKNIRPHIFRHYRSTILAKDPSLSTEIKKHYLGHAKSSKVFEMYYMHLKDEDVIDAVLEGKGLKEKTKKDVETKTLNCLRCDAFVAEDDKYCPVCWFALDQESVIEESQRIQQLEIENQKLKEQLGAMKHEIIDEVLKVVSVGNYQEFIQKAIHEGVRKELAELAKQDEKTKQELMKQLPEK